MSEFKYAEYQIFKALNANNDMSCGDRIVLLKKYEPVIDKALRIAHALTQEPSDSITSKLTALWYGCTEVEAEERGKSDKFEAVRDGVAVLLKEYSQLLIKEASEGK